jgi:hypothetical protein
MVIGLVSAAVRTGEGKLVTLATGSTTSVLPLRSLLTSLLLLHHLLLLLLLLLHHHHHHHHLLLHRHHHYRHHHHHLQHHHHLLLLSLPPTYLASVTYLFIIIIIIIIIIFFFFFFFFIIIFFFFPLLLHIWLLLLISLPFVLISPQRPLLPHIYAGFSHYNFAHILQTLVAICRLRSSSSHYFYPVSSPALLPPHLTTPFST